MTIEDDNENSLDIEFDPTMFDIEEFEEFEEFENKKET